MTSVPPHGLRAPMLPGGPHAGNRLRLMEPFGLQAEIVAEDLDALLASLRRAAEVDRQVAVPLSGEKSRSGTRRSRTATRPPP